MASSLKGISEIDRNRKLTIMGYVREYETIRNAHIPQEIVAVLILFYGHDVDEWDQQYISPNMKLSDKTITQKKPGCGSSFCKQIIESGTFKWRFRIDECKNYGFILGVWRVGNVTDEPPVDTWFAAAKDNGNFGGGYGWFSKATSLPDA